jgi:CubicO group peptidase (beta-lactamase class C family)
VKRRAILKKAGFVIPGFVGIALIVWLGVGHTGSNQSRFTGPTSAEAPLPASLVSDLERYVTRTMKQFDVPGVSMVLVHGDRVVYSRGIGVRDLETKAPVTTGTLFGIGSTTKSMTALMIATLVEDGVIDWDTPVMDVMPAFALSNPAIAKAVTFEHTLCMCTGVPRRMEEISTRYSEMTARDVVESLATIPLSGTFERQFNYSSRMLAAGGYLAAMAAGGGYGDLAQSYTDLMQERVLDPLGMTSSTFSIEEAVAGGNYATPYYSTLSGYRAVPPEIEGMFAPIAPAGSLWSNADDMANYLIMLLNGGVSAGGQRVVSAESLSNLWQPRVAIDAKIGYALGWHVEDYHGLQVIHHPGGTVGFASELVVIPERNVGFALLANRMDLVAPVGRMATYRLLEMLTGSEQVYDRQVREAARDVRRQVLTLSFVARKKVDPDEIAPYLGAYHNGILGEIELVLHEDNSLYVDFGEYESEVRRLVPEENQFLFYESVFVGKTLTLNQDAQGNVTVTWPGDEAVYRFVR